MVDDFDGSDLFYLQREGYESCSNSASLYMKPYEHLRFLIAFACSFRSSVTGVNSRLYPSVAILSHRRSLETPHLALADGGSIDIFGNQHRRVSFFSLN
jgi:hypothetical protein